MMYGWFDQFMPWFKTFQKNSISWESYLNLNNFLIFFKTFSRLKKQGIHVLHSTKGLTKGITKEFTKEITKGFTMELTKRITSEFTMDLLRMLLRI